MKPIGFLLGDTMPVISLFKISAILEGVEKLKPSVKKPKGQSGSENDF
jgi:hypothetical protein